MKKTWQLHRRSVLRGLGAGLALPMLDAMLPSGRAAAARAEKQPMRMLCVGVHLGFYGPAFFPRTAGSGYSTPQLLKPIGRYRKDFTVFSGVDHPGVGKGHPATANYLTGVGDPRKRRQMSMDQVAASGVGAATRFSSLQLQAGNTGDAKHSLSWAQGGIPLPTIGNPRALFEQLFAGRQQQASLNNAKSVLDHVLEDAHSLQRKLGKQDNEKLEEYLTSIRDVEQEIQKTEAAAQKPADVVADSVRRLTFPEKISPNITDNTRMMYQLIALAFQADLTRVATLRIPGENHAASHHGQKPKKVQQFVAIQQRYMTEFACLLGYMKSTHGPGGSLLDNTMILMGSGMGNSSNHSTRNLPILLAGGGFRHG